jgi:hypothetical protein
MIVKRIVIIFHFIIVLFTACNTNTDKNHQKYTDDFGPIKPLNTFELIKNSDFNQLFELRDSIYLDSDSAALINTPWQIRIYQDKFIISDLFGSRTIKVFSKSGYYLGQIGHNGAGPGEYKSAELLEIINDELFVYDPLLNRVSVFDVNSHRYLRNWKTDKFYASSSTVDNKLVFLYQYGYGYENDFDVWDINGNKINSNKFAKSLGEPKRIYMFGGSFQLSSIHGNILYCGADEFKIICYNINKSDHLWISQTIPSELKVPAELPKNVRDLGIKWMLQNYSSLKCLLTLEDGLILLFADKYILLYDDGGNYLGKLINPYPKGFFTTYGKKLILFKEGIKGKDGTLSNPIVLTYELIKKV